MAESKIGMKPTVMVRINQGIGTVLTFAGIVIICRSIFLLGKPIHS